MDQCVGLACRNAKGLVGDAELLFKAGRLETAAAFITFAKEEEGKAVMAAQWWFQRKNLTRDEYFEGFRARDSHLQKLVEATRIHYTQSMPDWLRKKTAEDELNRRERALYTDYDFELRQWVLPRLEFMAQLNPEMALEGEKHFEKFDSLVIQQDIKGIRTRVDWFLGQFQKRKNEHIPGAVVVLPDSEPTLLPVPKRFTLSFLQEMETALVDKRDALRNIIADTKYAKCPSFLSTSLIDNYRKQIQDEKLLENKRILTKLLVDELRRSTFGDFLTVLHFTERKWEYLSAMKLMNDFASRFGIPFCRQRRYPSIVKRLLNRLSERRSRPPFDVVQQWRDSYRECSVAIRTDNPSRDALKKYWKLETAKICSRIRTGHSSSRLLFRNHFFALVQPA